MGTIESKQNKPEIMTFTVSGTLSEEDTEGWRAGLEKFTGGLREKGAVGILLDVTGLEGFSIDAVELLIEVLSDPEEIFPDNRRVRLALIGIRPYTQRFLRAVMPLEPLKHVRARYFDEIAEDEALAWLQALVDSADDLPETVSKSAAATPDKPAAADKPAPEPKPPGAASQALSRLGLRKEDKVSAGAPGKAGG